MRSSAEEARAILSQRREVLDDVKTITAYAQDMSEFLNESELTERRAFIESPSSRRSWSCPATP